MAESRQRPTSPVRVASACTSDGDEAEREALDQALEEATAAFEQAREMLGVMPPPDSKPAVTLS